MLVKHVGTFITKQDGEVVSLPPGTPIDLPDDLAEEKIARGLASRVHDAAPPEPDQRVIASEDPEDVAPKRRRRSRRKSSDS